MNKADLAQALAEKLNISKREGEDMLNAFVDLVTTALKKNEEVVLTGFGAFSANPSFKTRQNPERIKLLSILCKSL